MVFLLLSFSPTSVFFLLPFYSYFRFLPTVVFFVPSFSDLHNDPSMTRQRLASDAERCCCKED